jgi:hypothetical protein
MNLEASSSMISTWQCEMMKIRAIERAINNFMKILIIN